MERIQLYIGHNVCGRPAHNEAVICRAVEARLGIKGYTVAETKGIWEGEAEYSSLVTILTDSEGAEALIRLIPDLAADLQQREILYTVETIRGDFIAARRTEGAVAA